MFQKRPGQEPPVEEVTVRQTAQKVSGRRPAQSVRHVLVDDPLERLQTRLRDLVRGLHELYEEQGHLAPIEPGEGYYPLHETLYAPPQGCVVLYDTDRVPPRLMLLTGDALDQSPDRPLATEPLERRRTPQKLREDYQELPDVLHEMRLKVFVCPPRILPRWQLFGHAGPYLVRDLCNVTHVLRYKTTRGSSLA